jgi:hypothetical protein
VRVAGHVEGTYWRCAPDSYWEQSIWDPDTRQNVFHNGCAIQAEPWSQDYDKPYFPLSLTTLQPMVARGDGWAPFWFYLYGARYHAVVQNIPTSG